MYQVEIFNLDHQGRGIGRINNKVIFIPKSLPGEIIEAKIVLEKKNFYEGEINNILKPSDSRITAICPHFNECGGCQYLNVNYEKSLLYKQNKVEDIIKKYLQFNIKINSIIKSEDNLFYRNKVTFQVDDNFGFYKEKSNELIPIDNCFIADKKINEIYEIIKTNINLTNIKQIIIRGTKNTKQSMVIFKVADYIDKNKVISILKDNTESIYINDELIYGKSNIIEKLLDCEFYISPSSFFQINTLQAEKLYSKAIEYANIKNNDLVLDLYCGTGTIGILASKRAEKVIGIELNKEAIKDANKNKELNNINNIEFYSGDVGKILTQKNYKPQVIIVDPPRAGLDNTAINQIKKIKPERLVYVSCDLMTLTRDLTMLSEYYNILELTPVDMFPMTSHVESVVKLELKKFS